ncbi:Stage II sporulation protein M [uncultured archaeon]|nr:Stage II sporulation protein M [uncultured archaeon]
MVLESLVVPEQWEKHPARMFFIGVSYATIGLFLGSMVFGKYVSLASVFITTMPLVVIMMRAIRDEEMRDVNVCDFKIFCIMKDHARIILFFLHLFVGMVVAYSFWFSVLPAASVKTLFASQIDTIQSITGDNLMVQGLAISASATAKDHFFIIVVNNLRVLLFCILMSFLYGAGAIFELTWNASVIGVAIGDLIRKIIVQWGGTGNPAFLEYFAAFPLSMSYLLHGLPEVLAYFLGALGGGIISVAVVKHHFRSEEFKRVVLDSGDLIMLSVVILILAAGIEVYVTPNLF